MKHSLALALFLWMTIANGETWRFALIGDVPYSNQERAELPKMLDTIAGEGVSFVAHVGDIKNGNRRCDDAVYEDRFELFDSLPGAFIFVPGDNEWTDCRRLSNGAYDPQERLDKLRRIFWSDSFSLGQKKLRLTRQRGDYPEHSRFRLGPVLFVTFNLPGDNNNFGMTTRAGDEFLARDPATQAWLKENFAFARRNKMAGIVLLFQADPEFKHFSQGLAHRGYRDFLENLRQETRKFAGQVVVVHGDTHWSRIDHPLREKNGQILTNFTRVETHGYPFMGWTMGTIDTDSPSLFQFTPHVWPAKGD